jgi:hypothetical protein
MSLPQQQSMISDVTGGGGVSQTSWIKRPRLLAAERQHLNSLCRQGGHQDWHWWSETRNRRRQPHESRLNLCAPASLQFDNNIYISSNNNVDMDLGLSQGASGGSHIPRACSSSRRPPLRHPAASPTRCLLPVSSLSPSPSVNSCEFPFLPIMLNVSAVQTMNKSPGPSSYVVLGLGWGSDAHLGY